MAALQSLAFCLLRATPLFFARGVETEFRHSPTSISFLRVHRVAHSLPLFFIFSFCTRTLGAGGHWRRGEEEEELELRRTRFICRAQPLLSTFLLLPWRSPGTHLLLAEGDGDPLPCSPTSHRVLRLPDRRQQQRRRRRRRGKGRCRRRLRCII